MKTLNLNNKNIPLVTIDKRLDKLSDKIMFSEKLKKANELLKTAKLPIRKTTL